MEKAIELKGLWWLPSHPDKKEVGTLRYTPIEDTELELIGEFREDDWLLDINSLHKYDIIWGLSSDGSHVTLIAPFPIDGTMNSSGSFPIVKYITPLVVQGKYLHSPDEKFLKRITVLYDELSIWYRPELIKKVLHSQKMILVERDSEQYKVELEIDPNTTLILSPQVNIEEKSTAIRTQQTTNLVIEFSQPVNLAEAIRVIDGFNQFCNYSAPHVMSSCSLLYESKYCVVFRVPVLHSRFRYRV